MKILKETQQEFGYEIWLNASLLSTFDRRDACPNTIAEKRKSYEVHIKTKAFNFKNIFFQKKTSVLKFKEPTALKTKAFLPIDTRMFVVW